MSAFICSPKHIGLLAAYRASSPNDAKDAARLLMAENVRSVSHRYHGEPVKDLPGPSGYDTKEALIAAAVTRAVCYYHGGDSNRTTPVAILRLADCLEYQSCETYDYYQSDAFARLNEIRSRAIRRLPGYEEAPWGI